MKGEKRLELIGLIVLILFVGIGWAENEGKPTKAQKETKGTQTIEPVLVFEYKFDEPIVDVIFDEATMTVKEARALGMRGLEEKKAMEIVKVKYPKVVKTEKALKFLDKEGRIVKTISLKTETKIVEKEGEKVNVHDVKVPAPYKVKYEICKNVVINKNAKLIGMQINKAEKVMVDENENFEAACAEPKTTGKYILLDFDGNVLFDKEFPEGRAIWQNQCAISAKGEAIVLFTNDTTGILDLPREIIYVYNKNGQEIFSFPSSSKKFEFREKNIMYQGANLEGFSFNGRYLAIGTRVKTKSEKYYTTLFYDLKRKTFWDPKKGYSVFSISNDGIVEAQEFGKGLNLYIDLKKYLGK